MDIQTPRYKYLVAYVLVCSAIGTNKAVTAREPLAGFAGLMCSWSAMCLMCSWLAVRLEFTVCPVCCDTEFQWGIRKCPHPPMQQILAMLAVSMTTIDHTHFHSRPHFNVTSFLQCGISRQLWTHNHRLTHSAFKHLG